MSDNIEPKCECVKRADGIYELTFHAFNVAAVDEFIAVLEGLYKDRTPSDPALCILANSPGSLPINYALQRGKELMSKYPNVGLVRVAVITDSAFEARLADSMVRLMRFATIRMRFFLSSRLDDACEWLLEGTGLPLQT
ncbi:MAG TPA: STAS/SEC14 domain-containing protein [Phototrophicaceae bacterium]|nr:STAS/SEC14 domain-containing protein [Phototrophicaceae bacterium]